MTVEATVGAIVSLASLAVALPVSVLAIECLVGTPKRRRAGALRRAPPFVILIPAHNEAAVIAATIKAVLAQLRPSDRLFVVADNCSDDTAVIARSLGANVIERNDPIRRGKGHALECGRAYLAGEPAAVVIVLDADCLPRRGALAGIAAMAAERNVAVQGAYLQLPREGASAMVQISSFAFLVKNLIRQRALQRLSGAAHLQGSGMAFPRRLFDQLEWNASSLVEDLDMGMALMLRGGRIAFDEASLFVSPASSQAGTASQRRRWEHGMLQTVGRFLPRLVGASVRGRGGLLILALDLMIPPTVLLLLISAAAILVGLVVVGPAAPIIVLLLANFALAIGLCGAWFVHGQDIMPPSSVLRIPRYFAWKLPILVHFITRRQVQWIRTEREL